MNDGPAFSIAHTRKPYHQTAPDLSPFSPLGRRSLLPKYSAGVVKRTGRKSPTRWRNRRDVRRGSKR